MERRRYLAGLAGAAGLLAGCPGRGDSGGDATATVTPAPVPGGDSVDLVDDSSVDPAAVADAHVSALPGGNARVAFEYVATSNGAPYGLTRIVSTVDGGARTYRRFDVQPLEFGGVLRVFRGFWYDSGRAVTRVFEAGHPSVYREPDDFALPPATVLFAQDPLVATLAGFGPRAESLSDGYRLVAAGVAAPARLPTGPTAAPGRDGRLSARLESSGLVPRLAASAAGSADADPLRLDYHFEITDRGGTTVERPSETQTYDWYLALREDSPIESPPPADGPAGTETSDPDARRRWTGDG